MRLPAALCKLLFEPAPCSAVRKDPKAIDWPGVALQLIALVAANAQHWMSGQMSAQPPHKAVALRSQCASLVKALDRSIRTLPDRQPRSSASQK